MGLVDRIVTAGLHAAEGFAGCLGILLDSMCRVVLYSGSLLEQNSASCLCNVNDDMPVQQNSASCLCNVNDDMPVQQYSAVTHADLCVQAIQRLAGTHSVEAMVWNSPAGRFLHPQVACLCLPCSDDTNLLPVACPQVSTNST